MRISVIITSHDSYDGLLNALEQVEKQTLAPYEVIAICSDLTVSEQQADDLMDRCDLIIQPNRNDWGHEKRAMGLELALGDYIAFFNDDDFYSSKYLATLADYAERRNADIVACDFVSHLAPDGPNLTMPAVGHVTSGNFIVRREIAQSVGYSHRHYQADGQFIEDLIGKGAKFIRVPRVLYVHK